MRAYVDIDGVLLTKRGAPAPRLEDFVACVIERFEPYWLTTHCKGDERTALQYLGHRGVTPAVLRRLQAVRPTNWDLFKTEAIDLTAPFVWFDDDPMLSELEFLRRVGRTNSLRRVDLVDNPNHLRDIVFDLARD